MVTHSPIAWTRVLFGAGMTLMVAFSPILYLALFAPSPDGKVRSASDGSASLGILSNQFSLDDHRATLVLIVFSAIALTLSAIAIAARPQHSEPQRSLP